MNISNVNEYLRFGIKGSNAALWLQQQGITTPDSANHWVQSSQGTMVLRLGQGEFLIEDQSGGQVVAQLLAASKAKPPGVYVVPRADATFRLNGEGVERVLAKICMLDITHELQANALLMTQVAGVSAVLLKEGSGEQSSYRLWCDVSYQAYMLNTLSNMASLIETSEPN
jgi:sarcosine oxidase subunit gamma